MKITKIASTVFLLSVFFIPLSLVHAQTFTALDPATKGVTVTLSNADLTSKDSGLGSFSMTYSLIGKSSGKWYWEVSPTINAGAGTAGIGVTTDTSQGTSQDYVGGGFAGYAYDQDGGAIYHSGSGSGSGGIIDTTDVLGIALDMDSGKVDFYRNNTLVGTKTGLSGTYYAMVATREDVNEGGTFNFGSTTLTYAPPFGYCAGLSDTCAGVSSSATTSTSTSPQVNTAATMLTYSLALALWIGVFLWAFFMVRIFTD